MRPRSSRTAAASVVARYKSFRLGWTDGGATLARKLRIALWHYAKDGIPEGGKDKDGIKTSSRTISDPRPAVAVVPTRTARAPFSEWHRRTELLLPNAGIMVRDRRSHRIRGAGRTLSRKSQFTRDRKSALDFNALIRGGSLIGLLLKSTYFFSRVLSGANS